MKIESTADRPCSECIWNTLDGCSSWECDPITRNEARERLNVVKCGECRFWSTGIAYETVGRCKHEDHKGQITNKNYFCADGK